MSGWPFRFVHASDFHLELPLFGVAQVPPHLRESFLDAPYLAAERVFDTVLAEDARFLILSGDILNAPVAGARGVLFLLEQFRRLAERDVSVYWAGGRVDPSTQWPAATELPDNVHVFPANDVGHYFHEHNGETLALLIGRSRGRSSRFAAREMAELQAGFGQGGYSIAVAHGEQEPGILQNSAFNYWALGGLHDRTTLFSSPSVAHYPGSPQGREPAELGAHGCTVVEVDERGLTRLSHVATDVLRWQSEQLLIGFDWTNETLRKRITNRAEHLRDGGGGVDQLVDWILTGEGPLASELATGLRTQQLLEELQAEFGEKHPLVWSLALEVAAPQGLPAPWYEEETLRGEFVRQIQSLHEDVSEPLGLEQFIPAQFEETTIGHDLALATGAEREQVLRRAAALGAELLTGSGDDFPLSSTTS